MRSPVIQNLNMTQPTVTRAIQELEDHYGVMLFDRINRRLQPTEEGNKLYLYAAKAMDLLDYMENGMRDWNETGIINIGATNSIGSTILPILITEFRQHHPNIQVHSLVSNRQVLQHAMESNELDFALIKGVIPGGNFCYEPFSKNRLVVLLPSGDPRANKKIIELDELKDDAFLLREKGSEGRAFVEALFAPHGFHIEPIMESVSTHALVQAVHAGIGISVLPFSLVQYSIESGFVATCQIRGVDLVRTNHIVWHEGKYITSVAKDMMYLCKEIVNR